jgi:hypothetical protein
MNLKTLSAAFLVGVSGTSLWAQLLPPLPNPPVLQKCTNSSDALCEAAATIYNAIIAKPAVPATAELAAHVSALLSLQNNPNMPGTSLQKVTDIWNSQNCSQHFTSECLELFKSLTYFYSLFTSGKASLPTQQKMNYLVTKKQNMSNLNPAPFYYFVFGFNMADAATNAVSSSSSAAHPPTLLPMPRSTASAVSAKEAVPSKK